MGRPGQQPFNAAPDTGRMGFRTEFEAQDERPLLYYPYSSFADESERLAYERAVSEIQPWDHYSAPRDFDPEEKRSPGAGVAWMGMEKLCQEIVSLAAGLNSRRGAVPDMPRTRMSRRERDGRLMKLRGQADEWDGKL